MKSRIHRMSGSSEEDRPSNLDISADESGAHSSSATIQELRLENMRLRSQLANELEHMQVKYEELRQMTEKIQLRERELLEMNQQQAQTICSLSRHLDEEKRYVHRLHNRYKAEKVQLAEQFSKEAEAKDEEIRRLEGAVAEQEDALRRLRMQLLGVRILGRETANCQIMYVLESSSSSNLCSSCCFIFTPSPILPTLRTYLVVNLRTEIATLVWIMILSGPCPP